jgi:hypothetical protein
VWPTWFGTLTSVGLNTPAVDQLDSRRAPLPQVHGHTATVDAAGQWLDHFVPNELTHLATKTPVTRHARFTPPNGTDANVGIDYGLWVRSNPNSLAPLVVQT